MPNTKDPPPRGAAKAYLVGGGIAALASAAYLIRDGGFAGQDIQILEEMPLLGGSLDGAGDPDEGYVIRGGRMFTYEAYTCTFDLLSFIPSLSAAGTTVKDEIYRFNEAHVSNSLARLVAAGCKLDASDLELSNRDRLDLIESWPFRSPRSGRGGLRRCSNRHFSRPTSGSCGAPPLHFSRGTARSS